MKRDALHREGLEQRRSGNTVKKMICMCVMSCPLDLTRACIVIILLRIFEL